MCNVGDRGYVHSMKEQTIISESCGLEFSADVNAGVPSRLKEVESDLVSTK